MSNEEFVPETEDEGNPRKEEVVETATSSVDNASQDAQSSSESNTGPSDDFARRFINDKWYGRYGAEGELLEFIHGDWKPLAEDDSEFVMQLWYEQEAADEHAKKYDWDEEKKEWILKEQVYDEDFIAQYQASYGVQHEDIYKKMDEELEEKKKQRAQEVEEKKEKKNNKRKLVEEVKPQGWIDLGDKVHAVYVSNLPLDITEDEFKDFMSKCGVVQTDPRTNKPKLKLYRDDEGVLKGDGRCCYIKKESVDLATSILDGATLKDKVVKVEEAHFELKGDFDPTKKKKKLSAAQKKRFMEQQNRIFEWKPEKPRNYRPPSDCVVIIKNLFTLEMMAKNAALLMDLKEEVEQSCEKYGTVKKVVVYDNNPEGVVSVAFTTTDESDMAVKFLNGRVVDGRKLTAELWDGKAKFKVEETEEEKEKRLKAWNSFIGAQEQEDDEE